MFGKKKCIPLDLQQALARQTEIWNETRQRYEAACATQVTVNNLVLRLRIQAREERVKLEQLQHAAATVDKLETRG